MENVFSKNHFTDGKLRPGVGRLPEVTLEVHSMAQPISPESLTLGLELFSFTPMGGEENLGHDGAPFSGYFL